MKIGSTRPALLAAAGLVLAGLAGEIAWAGLPREGQPVALPRIDGPLVAIVRDQAGKRLTEDEIREIAAAVEIAAERHRMDPLRILAIIAVESRYNPAAVSRRGARGLMQIRPVTFTWLQKQTRLHGPPRPAVDHGYDVQLGVEYLVMMERRFGSADRALMAYNAGPAKLARMLKRGKPHPLLLQYPRKVNREYQRLVALYTPKPERPLALAATRPRG